VKVIIHRGTNEIGASCVEIKSGGNRIFLDAGLPLNSGQAALPQGIQDSDGLFISHGHLDHCGLLDRVPASVPVYLSEVARLFAEASAVFRKESPLGRTTIPLKAGQKVNLGGLSVTAWLMDHSAPDAFGFLVQAKEGKSLFYTGDFRAHGRKQGAFERLIRSLPTPLDALIIEGTLLERSNAAFPDEASVEEAMTSAFREERSLACVICSGQNIDRIVTAFRAAKKSNRTMAIDIYTAWVLELFGRFYATTPRMGWEGVRVLAHGGLAARQYGIVKAAPEYFGDFRSRIYANDVAIQEKDIAAEPGRYLIKTNQPLQIINLIAPQSTTVVYSLWGGYLLPEYNPRQASDFAELSTRSDVRFLHIHTSGHGDLNTLTRLTKALKPKVLIPIHTEHKQTFSKFFEDVHVLDDGEEYEL